MPSNLPTVKGRVAFNDVTFSYDDEHLALQDFNLIIEPGQIVALVGPSGAGKSTVANLLPRFYDVQRGSLTIDDVDVRDVTFHSLRSQIGLVPQETMLFNASVKENILYGRLDATEAEVIAAAKAANAHDFIMELPEAYDTVVGDRGNSLSGGQRQRIAIARAILKNPRILILDEATSALDTESEKIVQGALDHLMKGRTAVVIAHRLSTVRDADMIVVIDKGRIQEKGTHEQLLKKHGLYANLYAVQFNGRTEG
jgi:subfamily B ATP-binding cassette protein MsbA